MLQQIDTANELLSAFEAAYSSWSLWKLESKRKLTFQLLEIILMIIHIPKK